MTARYTDPVKLISGLRIVTDTLACLFLERCVANYGILSKVLNDGGPQFLWKFLLAVRSTPWVSDVTTTEYHLEINGQKHYFNSTQVSRIQQYVSEHQADWDGHLFPLAHAHNGQVKRPTKMYPFSFAIPRTPPGTAIIARNVSP